MLDGREYDNLIPPCPFEKGSRGWVAWQSWLRLLLAGEKVGPPPGMDFDLHKLQEIREKKPRKGKPRRKKKEPPKIYRTPFDIPSGIPGRAIEDQDDLDSDD